MPTRGLIDIAHDVLSPYARNANTGNKYEISVCLSVLRYMGLTNEDLDTLEPLFTKIKTTNEKAKEAITKIIDTCRSSPVGMGFFLNSERIVDLRNVTQDDADGGTGDLICIMEDGTERSVSICEGSKARDGSISKCLTNPSARRLKVTEDDIAQFQARASTGVTAYKADYTARYGSDETTWPSRKKTTHATDACADVARWTSERFAGFDISQQIAIVKDLCCINDISTKPADYVALVNGKTLKPTFYTFNAPIFTEWKPRISADGIWLKIKNGDEEIGRIQVKFNNGVYHKGKTSSICTSWNATFNLTKTFGVMPARLD